MNVNRLYGEVTNLTNSEELSDTMVAKAWFRGRALHSGKLRIDATLDPYAKKPAFTVEVEWFITAATSDRWPVRQADDFEGLRYWMDATFPIVAHLLANAVPLSTWEEPTREPLAPDIDIAPPRPRDGETLPHL